MKNTEEKRRLSIYDDMLRVLARGKTCFIYSVVFVSERKKMMEIGITCRHWQLDIIDKNGNKTIKDFITDFIPSNEDIKRMNMLVSEDVDMWNLSTKGLDND